MARCITGKTSKKTSRTHREGTAASFLKEYGREYHPRSTKQPREGQRINYTKFYAPQHQRRQRDNQPNNNAPPASVQCDNAEVDSVIGDNDNEDHEVLGSPDAGMDQTGNADVPLEIPEDAVNFPGLRNHQQQVEQKRASMAPPQLPQLYQPIGLGLSQRERHQQRGFQDENQAHEPTALGSQPIFPRLGASSVVNLNFSLSFTTTPLQTGNQINVVFEDRTDAADSQRYASTEEDIYHLMKDRVEFRLHARRQNWDIITEQAFNEFRRERFEARIRSTFRI
ncbi:hypothetical protein CC86DRAFT_406117 [Ophiobolus disseminans]|uniref:Uncharacterized protein n=1 Tax=Ophiobolus disseminans TaxID=1469910 RepID=A0A6A7A2U5_9PLEO|nr:hypothetical protein CC86DRAFT_406117 [Ophiobolus disseminans]